MIGLIGSGFISSHLTQKLDSLGLEYKAIHHDEESPEEEFDCVFYLAAYGNLFTQTNECMMLQANVYDLYERLKEIKYSKYIHISTSSVTLPVQTMYSASKAAGEKICEGFAETHHKEIISVRPYTVIGTHEPDVHLIPQLIKHAYSGEMMPFVPSPTHDFIDVDDFCDVLVRVMETKPPREYCCVEVGSGIATKNSKVLELVEEVTGKTIRVDMTDEAKRPYDTYDWCCSHSVLKLKPLKQTIQEMVDDFKTKNT
jgi:nucleoside-diphosphate-sugar epimerase